MVSYFTKKNIVLVSIFVYIISRASCLIINSYDLVVILSFIGSASQAGLSTLMVLMLMDRYSNNEACKKNMLIATAINALGIILPFLILFYVKRLGWGSIFILPSVSGMVG